MSQALKEVEAYKLFAPHPNIIPSIDHSVESDKHDESAKTVYILLPYYRRGNLQDLINADLVNHTRFPEKKLMMLMLGVCRALKSMHQFNVAGEQNGRTKTGKQQQAEDENEVENQPLMESEVTRSQEGVAPGQRRAYAHRDIKPGLLLAYYHAKLYLTYHPGNIMIDDDGRTPILMDLGSIAPSPVIITSRSQAIAVQDEAGEHSTMPYRAPELWDVKTDSTIDDKVDIWSLGCTIYACLVGKSPFESRSDETGGSLGMCVMGGDWRFPDEGLQKGKGKSPGGGPAAGKAIVADVISESVKNVVRRCLTLEPAERPNVNELMGLLKEVIQTLPDEGSHD